VGFPSRPTWSKCCARALEDATAGSCCQSPGYQNKSSRPSWRWRQQFPRNIGNCAQLPDGTRLWSVLTTPPSKCFPNKNHVHFLFPHLCCSCCTRRLQQWHCLDRAGYGRRLSQHTLLLQVNISYWGLAGSLGWVQLSLHLITHYVIKKHGGIEVQLHAFWTSTYDLGRSSDTNIQTVADQTGVTGWTSE